MNTSFVALTMHTRGNREPTSQKRNVDLPRGRERGAGTNEFLDFTQMCPDSFPQRREPHRLMELPRTSGIDVHGTEAAPTRGPEGHYPLSVKLIIGWVDRMSMR